MILIKATSESVYDAICDIHSINREFRERTLSLQPFKSFAPSNDDRQDDKPADMQFANLGTFDRSKHEYVRQFVYLQNARLVAAFNRGNGAYPGCTLYFTQQRQNERGKDKEDNWVEGLQFRAFVAKLMEQAEDMYRKGNPDVKDVEVVTCGVFSMGNCIKITDRNVPAEKYWSYLDDDGDLNSLAPSHLSALIEITGVLARQYGTVAALSPCVRLTKLITDDDFNWI